MKKNESDRGKGKTGGDVLHATAVDIVTVSIRWCCGGDVARFYILYIIYIYIETVEIIILSAAAVILIKSGTFLSISHDDKRLYTTYIPLGRDKFGSKTA